MFDPVSIIIPSCGRPAKLATCLGHMIRLQPPNGISFEIIVAIDGGIGDPVGSPAEAIPGVKVLRLPQVGAAAARNAAMAAANGELYVFSNDDCYPGEDWLAAHLRAQEALGGGMVIGQTRWPAWPDATVLDGLLRDTSMVFFYDRMTPGADYGFRHYWTCNASVPATWARRVGGFEDRLRPVFFEDVEFAYRLIDAGCPGVRYEAAAVMEHDHRLSWPDYCRREAELGRMAALLGIVHPACFEAIYRCSAQDACATYRSWIGCDRGDHAAAASALLGWLDRPLATTGDWDAIRETLYALHLPIKRRLFREAFVQEYGRLTGDAPAAQTGKPVLTGR